MFARLRGGVAVFLKGAWPLADVLNYLGQALTILGTWLNDVTNPVPWPLIVAFLFLPSGDRISRRPMVYARDFLAGTMQVLPYPTTPQRQGVPNSGSRRVVLLSASSKTQNYVGRTPLRSKSPTLGGPRSRENSRTLRYTRSRLRPPDVK